MVRKGNLKRSKISETGEATPTKSAIVRRQVCGAALVDDELLLLNFYHVMCVILNFLLNFLYKSS